MFRCSLSIPCPHLSIHLIPSQTLRPVYCFSAGYQLFFYIEQAPPRKHRELVKEVFKLDSERTGRLIRDLRKEKGLTQKELAALLMVSDKAVSKWERGFGCPDISLLNQLSLVFNVNVECILAGDLNPRETDGGNMKRIKFYLCPVCGNVITSTTEAELSCCGRKLSPLEPKPLDPAHQPKVEQIENDFFITFDHEMSKQHFLVFAALVTSDRVQLVKLYPEQNPQIRLPFTRGGKFFICCNAHGLYFSPKLQPTPDISIG